eukprot:GHVQ01003250.1.p1 GENE.GHVQ01003250.1~~GHVQ01003250.1.p1  ORF type:complete len:258 (-),score=44.79 GHVQ01003250.1:945-1718(-)
MSNRHISFVGLGRIRDQALLAGAFDRLSTYEKNSIEANFQTCLSEAVSRCSPGSRQKRVFKEGTCLYVLADNDLCCLYVVACKTAEFPERHAFALLSEVVRMVTEHDEHGGDVPRYLNNLPVGGLTKPLRRALKDVMDRFDDPVKFDRTAEVQAKVESTKEVMEDNLKKIMESHANIRTLQDKTDNLATSASQFNRSAGDLRRMMWWRKVKVTIVLGLMGVAVVAYGVILIVKHTASSSGVVEEPPHQPTPPAPPSS